MHRWWKLAESACISNHLLFRSCSGKFLLLLAIESICVHALVSSYNFYLSPALVSSKYESLYWTLSWSSRIYDYQAWGPFFTWNHFSSPLVVGSMRVSSFGSFSPKRYRTLSHRENQSLTAYSSHDCDQLLLIINSTLTAYQLCEVTDFVKEWRLIACMRTEKDYVICFW